MNRWTVALHEAGHAVAGFVLTGCRVAMTLHEDGGGAAWPHEELPPTDRAIMCAAGPLAEWLAERYPAPELLPPTDGDGQAGPRPLPTMESLATPDALADIKRSIARAPSDFVVIARWCISGAENEPMRWVRRHAWVYAEAERLIRDHEQSIVEAARVLYQRGVVSVPLFERNAS